jgi:membrane-associated phospholipid phosphatase
VTAAFIDALAALPFLIWVVTIAVRSKRSEPVAAIVRATLWAVAISYLLAHVNRWLDLWASHPNFPSGHVTAATCMWTALALVDRRYAPLGLAVLALLAYALVAAGWHGRLDVAGGFVLGSMAMLAFGAPYRRARASTESSKR